MKQYKFIQLGGANVETQEIKYCKYSYNKITKCSNMKKQNFDCCFSFVEMIPASAS